MAVPAARAPFHRRLPFPFDDLAGIGEAVHRADRHIGGLVLVIELHVLADGDLGDAAHHDPVLGAVEVLLQREPCAGFTQMRLT
jgi:hypothetical protein